MPRQKQKPYIGRFAPSPTGPVHFGTLIAALGSCLQAKNNNGRWLMRMEDVDTTRTVEGADTDILKTLESFGFEWHGDVTYQSKCTGVYQQVLDKLIEQSNRHASKQALVFPCICSRKQLTQTGSSIYPGTCRQRQLPETQDHALRLLAKDIDIRFSDIIMGEQSQNIQQDCGDFIIRRRDRLFAYQLAVVVDDARQGITEIVRGADLLDSTPRQIYLQQLLGYDTPAYCHLPLAVDASGSKISKSEGAASVDIKNKEELLCRALTFLGQDPPADLSDSDIDDIWQWASRNWNIDQIPRQNHVLV